MQVNQISQLTKLLGTQGTSSILGAGSGSDTNSGFENILKEMINTMQTQNPTSANTSVSSTESKDNIVSALDSLSLQPQKAQQLQQMELMSQMMQSMASQDSGDASSDSDSSDSLFPTTNSSQDYTKLIEAMIQNQTNGSSTTTSSNSVSNLV